MASPAELTPEDQALLDRLARRVVELRMEVPAVLTLESTRPLGLLAGQAMTFFEPFVQALFRLPDYRRIVALIERRAALEALTVMIERHAEEARAARRASRAPAGPPRPGAP